MLVWLGFAQTILVFLKKKKKKTKKKKKKTKKKTHARIELNIRAQR